jgi:CheY-like chemotaxis protein
MAKRILIADDSVTIQKAFAMTFGGEDLTIMSARSADEGLALARQVRPELVIADGVMPGRSGYELCAAIKSDPNLQGTAVYILASSHQPYDDARGHQSGADGYLLKPFETNAIIEKVREAVAKGPSPDARPAPSASRTFSGAGGVARPFTAPQMPAVAFTDEEDEYGELTVDVPNDSPPLPTPPRPEAPAQMTSVPAARPSVGYPGHPQPPAAPPSAPPVGGMRPSMIPGIRPGVVPLARPGAPTGRQLGPGAAPPGRPPAPLSRTLTGLPAANVPIPGSIRPIAAPTRPTTAAPMAAPARATAPLSVPPSSLHSPFATPPVSPPAPAHAAPAAAAPPAVSARPSTSALVPAVVSAAVGAAVEQRMATFAAKGPEYEAIAKLSREIIEQIVWEVVPELADAIIREQVREHLDKRRPA